MEKNRFATWLKDARSALGLTQDAVAEVVGYSAGHISGLERGVVVSKKGQPVRPDIDLVDKLAKVLHRPIAEAREAAGYAAPNRQKTSESERANAYFEALPKERQMDALAVLEVLYVLHGEKQGQEGPSKEQSAPIEPELVKFPHSNPKDWRKEVQKSEHGAKNGT